MRKKDGFCAPRRQFAQRVRTVLIVEVSVAAEDAAFEFQRIRTALNHLDIVVRFKHQRLTAGNGVHPFVRDMPDIRCDAAFQPLRVQRKADGVVGVMRNMEGADIHTADIKILSGLYIMMYSILCG